MTREQITPNVAPAAALEDTRIVAILRHTDPARACETVEALVAGGVRAVEVTFNSAGVAHILDAIATTFGTRVLLGAGTVLSQTQADHALDCGAQFIVSPHTDLDFVSGLAARGVPCIPGALTPTEILSAWRAGASAVKVFPAGSVGPPYIKDLRGPLDAIRLVPTGGVTLDNASAFVAAGAWGLGVGSALVDGRLIAAGRFDQLTDRARAFADIARQARANT
ncbi:MAG: bifunctional 4-hydroxy-2-oxoglutarate aldolase/2-dehydro-3-deoxy-phosphogluconate aldolase [Chloroflexota bacterium]